MTLVRYAIGVKPALLVAVLLLAGCDGAVETPPQSTGDAGVIDTDRDGDGVPNDQDAFPDDPGESADLDGDGIGDNADPDVDGDGVANEVDAFPRDPAESADLDGDGLGDNADPDVDGDGVANDIDAFPRDPAESADLDGDGVGDNADTDVDGDGVLNDVDAFPTDPAESADLDEDGVGDNADTDVDGDGVLNDTDAFPRDPAESADLDEDGIGDNGDTDVDGDGVLNDADAFPRDPAESRDTDADGVGDNADPFPQLVVTCEGGGCHWVSGLPISLPASLAGELETQLATGPVTITVAGALTIAAPLSWTSGNTLTLSSDADLFIDAPVNATAGKLVLRYGQGAVAAGNTADYHVHAPVRLAAGPHFSTQLGSDGAVVEYTVVTELGTAAHASTAPSTMSLQGIGHARADNFALGADIDASVTAIWNSDGATPPVYAGFKPIGATQASAFTGRFAGLGHAIGSLTVNRPADENVGLFGVVHGTVRDLRVEGGSIKGRSNVGGLAGLSSGTLTGCLASSDLVGITQVGGLLGSTAGTGVVRGCRADGSVLGSANVGGLVGFNDRAAIELAYATGAVSGYDHVGGLVGVNGNGTISRSHASGTASCTGYAVGGLIGLNQLGMVTEVYATGEVTGAGVSEGGLVGEHRGLVLGANPVTRFVRALWDSSANPTLNGVGKADLPVEVSEIAGATLSQLMTAATFVGWDLSALPDDATTWFIVEGTATPRLRHFESSYQPPNLDGDALSDSVDPDVDGDGVENTLDVFPLDAAEWLDTDTDGVGDNADPDLDGDGVPNGSDAFPDDKDETLDTDGDGIGDNADPMPATPNYEVVWIGDASVGECPHGGRATKRGLDANADGTLQPSEVDVSKTHLICEPQRFAIGGTVSGLPSDGSVWFSVYSVGGGEMLGISNDGPFTFGTGQPTGSEYSISVSQPLLLNQPATRYCEAAPGSHWNGIVGTAPVNVAIACYQHRQVLNVAGNGSPGSFGSHVDGVGLTQATFNAPHGLAVSASGTVYVADTWNDVIRAITPTGMVSTVETPWLALNDPQGVAVNASGDLYVANSGDHSIKKIAADGQFSTFATSCSGTNFNTPMGLAVDSDGYVYVADSYNNRICRISPQGVATTFATGFQIPRGVAVDAMGTVFVADSFNDVIRKVTKAGVVTTLAGTLETFGSADGTGSSARFFLPEGIAVDAVGNVYVADSGNKRIRKITPAGVVSTLAGSNNGNADGVGTAAQFARPSGVAVDPAGNLFVADEDNDRIRKVILIAGGPDDQPATDLVARFQSDTVAMFQLSILKSSWNSGTYGPVPEDAIIFDFAWKKCRETPGCVTPGDAMVNAISLLNADSANITILANWIPLVDGVVTPQELAASFESSPAAMALLNAYKAGWKAGTYGPVPANGVFFDFARVMCKQVTGCATPLDAMTHAVELLFRDPTYAAIVAAWTELTAGQGWGDCAIGGFFCYSGPISNAMLKAAWKGATSPGNLIATASLVQGMLGQLQQGDPGYGTSLVSALKTLGNVGSPISRGLISVILMQEAARLAELQRMGETLTAEEQAFASLVANRMIAQSKTALAQIKAEFDAFQEANRPPIGGHYYLGTPPTDAMKQSLIALIPNTTPSQSLSDTSTTTGRLLTAIGVSQRATAGGGSSVDSTAVIAGVGVGVPLAAAVTAIGLGTATFAVTFGTGVMTVSATVGSATVLGLSGGLAATGGVTGGVIASAVAGPAVIVVAAVAVLGAGIATVAQVNEFTNAVATFESILNLYSIIPPPLGTLTALPHSMWGYGCPAQMQFAIINLVTEGSGFGF